MIKLKLYKNGVNFEEECVVNPDNINTIKKQPCYQSKTEVCALTFVGGGELWVHHSLEELDRLIKQSDRSYQS